MGYCGQVGIKNGSKHVTQQKLEKGGSRLENVIFSVKMSILQTRT